jgi:hypothetical protein
VADECSWFERPWTYCEELPSVGSARCSAAGYRCMTVYQAVRPETLKQFLHRFTYLLRDATDTLLP